MKNSKITIVIADDHSMVCRGLQALFSTENDLRLVVCAANGHEAIELCRKHKPTLAILDIIMPGLGGIEAAKIIHRDLPHTEMMILTSVETEQSVCDAVQAGVRSYLLKDTQPDELLSAVRATGNGQSVFSPRVAAILARSVANKKTGNLAHSSLTAREMEVLRLLAQGLSNKELADKLQISEKTIKSHVSNVLDKLSIADRTQAAIYAWRSGIAK